MREARLQQGYVARRRLGPLGRHLAGIDVKHDAAQIEKDGVNTVVVHGLSCKVTGFSNHIEALSEVGFRCNENHIGVVARESGRRGILKEGRGVLGSPLSRGMTAESRVV
jgi:hypothetical protein